MAQVTDTVCNENILNRLGEFAHSDYKKLNGNAPISGVRKGSREWCRMVRDGLIKE